jgi:hypothetical protein
VVPALALSGFSGPLISLVVIFGGGNESAAPLLPLDAGAGAALASNVFLVAAAFMLLTIGMIKRIKRMTPKVTLCSFHHLDRWCMKWSACA